MCGVALRDSRSKRAEPDERVDDNGSNAAVDGADKRHCSLSARRRQQRLTAPSAPDTAKT